MLLLVVYALRVKKTSKLHKHCAFEGLTHILVRLCTTESYDFGKVSYTTLKQLLYVSREHVNNTSF